MAIENFAEYFGCDDHDIFNEKEQAEGYIQGTQNAIEVQRLVTKVWGNRSRAFREGLLQALREQL